jgi:hypothetical protein
VKPASISAKGRTGEHEVAAMVGGKRNVLSGAVGGNDVIDARAPYDGLAIEVKRRARLPAIATEPLAQAAYAARGGGRLPAVFYREDGGRWIVAMYAEDFTTWVDAIHEVGGRSRVRAIGRELETIGRELKGTR